MSEIVLGKQQEEAINYLINFINNPKESVCGLYGYAGTGKSTLIKWLAEYLEKEFINYIIITPTHKARAMVMYNTGLSAFTIHQVLSLFPNIEIQNLDYKDLEFVKKNKFNQVPKNGVIICDEASMVNDVLFEYLNIEALKNKSKIIFTGDEAQLKPVNSESRSKVFKIQNKVMLTEIFRQSKDCGFSNTLVNLRKSIINRFEESIGSEGSLYIHNSAKSLFEAALPVFRESIISKDIFNSKFLAYTNDRTNALNLKIRNLLFKGEEIFQNNEMLTFYDNFTYEYSNFWNSMDYIILYNSGLKSKNIEGFGKVFGYYLVLFDYLEKLDLNIFVIDPKTDLYTLNSLAAFIETTRQLALENKFVNKLEASKYWKRYYYLMGSFANVNDLYYQNRVVKKTTFKYGYATTVHKSQASSINNVFIDMGNILSCRDVIEIRQLQYVAVSRTRNNVHILQ